MPLQRIKSAEAVSLTVSARAETVREYAQAGKKAGIKPAFLQGISTHKV